MEDGKGRYVAKKWYNNNRMETGVTHNGRGKGKELKGERRSSQRKVGSVRWDACIERAIQ